jgi:hypothetical protein
MPIRFWRPVLKHCCDIRLPFKRKRQQSFATMFSLGEQSRRGVLRNRSFSQHAPNFRRDGLPAFRGFLHGLSRCGHDNSARGAYETGSETALETLKRRVTSGWPVSIMRSEFSRGPRHRSQQPQDRFAAEPSPHGDRSKPEAERLPHRR